ncbi:hypothetical protein ALC60_13553 [Trachymyrmex zeteki]|uniref:Circadian clock-controlled protein n=1 Tax=Mycetomoellerius zeteki TaxID=64791 RepID=A0A151WHX4_9HYME|nr:PREDICTED: uncharacterized protein LOC108729913 [Trachymyrmex zeteki]KYQ47432.1 hypothetical protein ALC60_13553 [Trachymyrmex zeteki]
MNFVAFGLILICCHVWANENNNNFLVRGTYQQNTSLKDYLENKVKPIMQNGDNTLGIPVLDPFVTDKLFGFLSNVNVTGLSAFEINDADFNLLNLVFNLDLNWPSIIARANYFINRNNNTEINGKGGTDVAVKDFKFTILVNFKVESGKIQINEIKKMFIGLGAFDFHVTGLYKDDKKNVDLSKMISDTVFKLINTNQVIAKTVMNIITMIFNKSVAISN